jgi:hypothetical protein
MVMSVESRVTPGAPGPNDAQHRFMLVWLGLVGGMITGRGAVLSPPGPPSARARAEPDVPRAPRDGSGASAARTKSALSRHRDNAD